MKTFGIIEQRRLVSLPDDGTGNPDWMSASPDGLYTADDPRAPWNAPDPILTEAPEGAPLPEPINRNPLDYPGVLWVPPAAVPLVKLPAPSVSVGQIAEPTLVWHADRVERSWSVRAMTSEERADATRKIWADSNAFWDALTSAERSVVATSTHPMVKELVITLGLWRGRLFSDDPRVSEGLQLLEVLGILTAERKAEILA
jgi:hypothetical protein